MTREVQTFLLRGVVLFLLLELIFLPLREPLVGFLQGLLPPDYGAVWACTGLDEVFLYVSFLLAYPSRKGKLPHLVVGVLVLELYNAFRIILTIHYGNQLLHDVLFRWGGYLLVLTLFYLSFRRLSTQQ